MTTAIRHGLPMFLLLVGCATGTGLTEVASRHDPGYDFAGVKTFNWGEAVPVADPRLDDLQRDPRVRSAITGSLEARGLVAQAGDGDLSVWVYPEITGRVDVTIAGHGAGFAAPQSVPSPGAGDGSSGLYSRDGLLLDLVDSATDRVVWRGRVVGRVDPASGEAPLRELFDRLLATFPSPQARSR